jgi:hypothetical protein
MMEHYASIGCCLTISLLLACRLLIDPSICCYRSVRLSLAFADYYYEKKRETPRDASSLEFLFIVFTLPCLISHCWSYCYDLNEHIRSEALRECETHDEL